MAVETSQPAPTPSMVTDNQEATPARGCTGIPPPNRFLLCELTVWHPRAVGEFIINNNTVNAGVPGVLLTTQCLLPLSPSPETSIDYQIQEARVPVQSHSPSSPGTGKLRSWGSPPAVPHPRPTGLASALDPSIPVGAQAAPGGAQHRLPHAISCILEVTDPDSQPAAPAIKLVHLDLGRTQAVSSAVAFDPVLTTHQTKERVLILKEGGSRQGTRLGGVDGGARGGRVAGCTEGGRAGKIPVSQDALWWGPPSKGRESPVPPCEIWRDTGRAKPRHSSRPVPRQPRRPGGTLPEGQPWSPSPAGTSTEPGACPK